MSVTDLYLKLATELLHIRMPHIHATYLLQMKSYCLNRRKELIRHIEKRVESNFNEIWSMLLDTVKLV